MGIRILLVDFIPIFTSIEKDVTIILTEGNGRILIYGLYSQVNDLICSMPN
jgi:hypothetical protein